MPPAESPRWPVYSRVFSLNHLFTFAKKGIYFLPRHQERKVTLLRDSGLPRSSCVLQRPLSLPFVLSWLACRRELLCRQEPLMPPGCSAFPS